MPASLKELDRRIRSVKNTQQITRAMKMVAAAKLRRAQDKLVAARPYGGKLEELLDIVFGYTVFLRALDTLMDELHQLVIGNSHHLQWQLWSHHLMHA